MTKSKKSILTIFLSLFFVFGISFNCMAVGEEGAGGDMPPATGDLMGSADFQGMTIAASTPLQAGLNTSAQVSGYIDINSKADAINNKSPEDVIAAGIKIALQIMPIVYLILLLYAGFVWMLSSGDPKKVSDAKSMLIHSSIGFIMIYVSALLVYEIMMQVWLRT